MIIGSTIIEAIDWTQDRFVTTRPIAERTLFSMLSSNIIEETEDGYVLLENDEEPEKHYNKTKSTMNKSRTRIKFHAKRKSIHEEKMQKRKMKHLDNCDAATDMENAENSYIAFSNMDETK